MQLAFLRPSNFKKLDTRVKKQEIFRVFEDYEEACQRIS